MTTLDRFTGDACVGSIMQVAAQLDIHPAVALMQADVCILFDNSGSMISDDAPDHMTRYEFALEQLKKQQRTHAGKLFVVEFNSRVAPCLSGLPVEPYGGTDLLGALEYVRDTFDKEGRKLIIISDGMPNPGQEQDCQKLVAGLHCQVNSIYCGPNSQEPLDFLLSLAKANDKQGRTFNRPQLQDIGTAFDKLLPPPQTDST